MTNQEKILLAVALYYPDSSDPFMGPSEYLSVRAKMDCEETKSLLDKAMKDSLVSCEYKLTYHGRRMLEKQLVALLKD